MDDKKGSRNNPVWLEEIDDAKLDGVRFSRPGDESRVDILVKKFVGSWLLQIQVDSDETFLAENPDKKYITVIIPGEGYVRIPFKVSDIKPAQPVQ